MTFTALSAAAAATQQKVYPASDWRILFYVHTVELARLFKLLVSRLWPYICRFMHAGLGIQLLVCRLRYAA